MPFSWVRVALSDHAEPDQRDDDVPTSFVVRSSAYASIDYATPRAGSATDAAARIPARNQLVVLDDSCLMFDVCATTLDDARGVACAAR